MLSSPTQYKIQLLNIGTATGAILPAKDILLRSRSTKQTHTVRNERAQQHHQLNRLGANSSPLTLRAACVGNESAACITHISPVESNLQGQSVCASVRHSLLYREKILLTSRTEAIPSLSYSWLANDRLVSSKNTTGCSAMNRHERSGF